MFLTVLSYIIFFSQIGKSSHTDGNILRSSNVTTWKVSKYTGIYGVNLRIQSKYRNIWTKKTPYLCEFIFVKLMEGNWWMQLLRSSMFQSYILIRFNLFFDIFKDYILNPLYLHSLLTVSWRRPISYRNQSIDLLCKSMDWFLYDIGLRHGKLN